MSATLDILDFDRSIEMGTETSRHEYYSAVLCLQGRKRLCVFTMKSYQQLTISNVTATVRIFVKKISSNSRLLSLQKLTDPPGASDSVQIMSTERCAELMVVSIANNLDEVWISREPALLMTYLNQYFPNLYRWYVLYNVTSQFM